MFNKLDTIKMIALGRNFSIGTLYNHIEDVIVPNMRLWDPSDVSCLATVKTERKETVKVHSIVAEQMSEEEDDIDDDESGTTLLSDLGMDNHSAMSLMAGLLHPSLAGAWQYPIDQSDSTMGLFDLGSEVAIHCRSSSRKVSVDPTSLEIICRPERLIKSQATHVVVAVTYGLEAFCIFSPQLGPHPKSSRDEDDYAHYFANGLLNGRNQLELDEEDEDGRLIPLNLQCLLYSDLIGVKSGQSWTLKDVGEQYQACRKVMDHLASTAIPLRVWLYPLGKLMQTEANNIYRISSNILDLPRDLVIRWQKMWNRMRRVRRETDSLVHHLQQSSNGHIPPNCRQRIKDFDGLMAKFTSALQSKLLPEWTTCFRKGADLSTKKMLEMMEAIENKSPFSTKGLSLWLSHQSHQIETLTRLVQLPGIRFFLGADQLKKEIKNPGYDRSFAVVLHLPSLAGQSDICLVKEMSRFVDVLSTSHPSSWTQWASNNIAGLDSSRKSAARRRCFIAGQEFSGWVTDCNRDTPNVRYMVFYDEELRQDGESISPSIRLYDSCSGEVVQNNFIIPKAPGPVTVKKNYRGVITLSWTTEEEVDEPNFILQYRSMDRSGERWNSIQHNTKEITINYLQSEESYVFRVAAVTPGGRSSFNPINCEVTINPVCRPPIGVICQSATDTSITISWYHFIFDEEEIEVASETESEQEMEITVKYFAVECWADGNQDSSFIQRSTTNKTFTIEPLVPDTLYCVQVRAVCTDTNGSVFYSSACRILKIRTLREAERAAPIVRRSSRKCSSDRCPGVDFYTLPVKKHRGAQTQGVGHYVLGKSSYLALAGKRRQRTILMLGATGSGKSTLINAMVNYMLGIEWDDDFRFKLIDEPADKSQAHSQTDLVTTYDFYEMKGSRLNYSLTVVDTPGFGDTRGLEKDKKIMQQIQNYFQCRHGIQQLEAVCFVVQSSLPRLTATQQYIFDSILSIFGQDIKDNIRLMVTFADGFLPPVLGAVKEAGIPSPMDPATGLPLHNYLASTSAAPVYYTEALKCYTTKAPEYYTTAHVAPSYYAECPRYFSSPSYTTE